MEVKIRREIREYSEKIFFGMTLRQLTCSILAVAAAVCLYFGLWERLHLEVLSWVCVLVAIPFAFLGFSRYNGMTAEVFLWVWLRSEVMEPKILLVKPYNHYREILKKGKRYG